jgi:hypothetical protein
VTPRATRHRAARARRTGPRMGTMRTDTRTAHRRRRQASRDARSPSAGGIELGVEAREGAGPKPRPSTSRVFGRSHAAHRGQSRVRQRGDQDTARSRPARGGRRQATLTAGTRRLSAHGRSSARATPSRTPGRHGVLGGAAGGGGGDGRPVLVANVSVVAKLAASYASSTPWAFLRLPGVGSLCRTSSA